MTLFRALPRRLTRPLSIAIVLAWAACMVVLVNRSYLQASASLATDLAQYGSTAVWRGVYYRGEKIGFTVSQTIAKAGGFEIQEDGRLQMTLLGATTPAVIKTTARVDREFALRSFDFSLDPGTGPIRVRGALDGRALTLTVSSSSGSRTETRVLPEAPALSLNLGRRLAGGGLVAGARYDWTMFDPATLRNERVRIVVGARELVRGGVTPTPAFRVDLDFGGLRTTSWITDTGDVIREESPLGLMTIRETPERARALAVPLTVQSDLLRSAAVVPLAEARIDETRDVKRITLNVQGLDPGNPDLQGAGQTVEGNTIEIRDFTTLLPAPHPPTAELARHLASEPLIESDAPEILAEARQAVEGVSGARLQAERLVRHVNGLLDKKPTVSLPSAREVLRTRVGDCNEHTALYVAMARALGIPARIAVGLVYIHGAFYYHAWPEVYLRQTGARGLWLPVDPTLNQFPADATHVRLARGGLDRQAAILPLIGRLKIAIVDVQLAPGASQVLVGQSAPRTALGILEPARSRSWRRCQ